MIATDRKFKDIHLGKECLIIGGGHKRNDEYVRMPVLDSYRHYVIGCNNGFKARKLDYLVLKDAEAWRRYKAEQVNLNIPIFYIGAKENSDEYISVKKSELPMAGASFDDGICGYLSGYCAVHLALLMGFRKIYLTGFWGGTECVDSLSKNFVFFTEWISRFRREIYIAEPKGILKGIFKYESI